MLTLSHHLQLPLTYDDGFVHMRDANNVYHCGWDLEGWNDMFAYRATHPYERIIFYSNKAPMCAPDWAHVVVFNESHGTLQEAFYAATGAAIDAGNATRSAIIRTYRRVLGVCGWHYDKRIGEPNAFELVALMRFAKWYNKCSTLWWLKEEELGRCYDPEGHMYRYVLRACNETERMLAEAR